MKSKQTKRIGRATIHGPHGIGESKKKVFHMNVYPVSAAARKPFIGGKKVTRKRALRGLGKPEDWDKMMTETLAEFRKKPFTPGIALLPDVKAVRIILENVSYVAEWIQGEGADISLYRALDDGRVVGALLPWNNVSAGFVVC